MISLEDAAQATSHGVMHAEDIGRARVFVRLAFALAAFGTALAPLVQGDAFARKVMIGGTTVIAIVNAWLWRELRTDAGYTVTRAIAVGHVTMIGAFGAFYFFGFFSAVAMTLPLGLFIFSLGQSVRATFGLYAACAALYGLLGTLTATGAIADRGLLSPMAITFWDRIVAVAGAEGILLASYVAARATRASTLVALHRHDQAVRKLGIREALLREARVDLDRALKAGGLGRFSDTQLGSFRLGRVLGRRGMGEVYEATHVATHEPAAVKLLHARMLADPEVVRRFLRELKIASSLESVHVVRVLEIGGLDARFPYLAMELLHGEDLASVLRHTRQLPPRSVVALVRDVGEVLLAARRAGIVHRDLKPQNLFLAELAGGDRCSDGPGRVSPAPRGEAKEDTMSVKKHVGRCHCGAGFEVDVDASAASRCNCTTCTKTGVLGAIVKPDALRVLKGEADLATYEWGPRISKRFFCKHCGVHCFARGHLAEVGGDYASVNLNCLDDVELSAVEVTYWDGRHDNWMAGKRATPWPIFTTAAS